VNVYVLIGGRSRRMGVSKTALFLPRIIAAARPAFDEVIAVQRFGGDAAHAIRTIFEDAHEDDGAIFGVAAALRHARARCFILGVDYPLITSDVLRFLIEHDGVPVWNGQPQPLCAVWDFAALSRIEQHVLERRYDLHALLEQAMIPEPILRARFRGEPLMNVNTPQELERAEALYGE
jgi:molybdopterin-guanine dinucleotide biosynthesis protein A